MTAAIVAFKADDVIDAYRAQLDEPSDHGDDRVPATHDLDRCATWTSAALSALFTNEDPLSPFRFRVELRPELAEEAPGDFTCTVAQNSVDTQIYRVPRRLMDAPEEFRSSIFAYLVADSYIATVRREQPTFDWGIDDPARSMVLDAIGVSAEALFAARQSIWN